MFSNLVLAALSSRLLVFVLTGVLCILGWRSLQQLPIDAFPDITTTQVQVIVKAPGMTPEEIEQRVTQALEIEIRGIPNQTVLRSMTKYGLCVITTDFTDDTDLDWARQQVNQRITQVLADLPEGVEGGLGPVTTPLSDVYMFLVEGEGHSKEELRGLLDWQIRKILARYPGVVSGFTQPIDMRVSEMLSGVTSAVAIKLTGPELEGLEEFSSRIEEVVNEVPGAIDVARSPLTGQLYYQIDLNHEMLSRLGIEPDTVNKLVSEAIGGTTATEVIEGIRRIPVIVRYPEESRTGPATISQLTIPTPSGQAIPLSTIATIQEIDGPGSIGFIALLGTAVMNGVVLISYLNQLREESDLGIEEATRTGAERRFRPVMMTAVLTVIGLVPILFARGPGSEIQKPLAAVVVGGTVTSTALTLLLLPALYASLETRIKKRLAR